MIILSLHEKNSHDFPWREFVQRDVTGVYQEFAKETNNARGESEQIREANRVESNRRGKIVRISKRREVTGEW